MRIQKTIEVEVPAGVLTFDIGAQNATCSICNKSANRSREGDARSESYDLERFFSAFAGEHFDCIRAAVQAAPR